MRHAVATGGDAFCRTRLGGDRGLSFGTLPRCVGTDAILTWAPPAGV